MQNSARTLHVAVDVTKQSCGTRRGFIHDPDALQTTDNYLAMLRYHQFYKPDASFRLVPLQTQMSPQELVAAFGTGFRIDSSILGITVTFTFEENELEKLLRELTTNAKKYFERGIRLLVT